MIAALLSMLGSAVAPGADAILVIELSYDSYGKQADALVERLHQADPARRIDHLILGSQRGPAPSRGRLFASNWDPSHKELRLPDPARGSDRAHGVAATGARLVSGPLDPSDVLNEYRCIVVFDIAAHETESDPQSTESLNRDWWRRLAEWARPGLDDGTLGVALDGRLYSECGSRSSNAVAFWSDLLGRLDEFDRGWLVLGSDGREFTEEGIGDLIDKINELGQPGLGASFAGHNTGDPPVAPDQRSAQIAFSRVEAHSDSVKVDDASRFDVVLRYPVRAGKEWSEKPALVVTHDKALRLPVRLNRGGRLEIGVTTAWRTERTVRLAASPIAQGRRPSRHPEHAAPVHIVDTKKVPPYAPSNTDFDWPDAPTTLETAFNAFDALASSDLLVWLEASDGERISTTCRVVRRP